MPSVPTLRARLDPGLSAVLGELVPLRYADGGSPDEDRPAIVRGASAVLRDGRRLVIVQDDVHVLAVREADGRVAARLLPADAAGRRAFDDARGNKQGKLDLESAARLPDGRLVALGSGSSPARERIVVAGADGPIRLVDATALYAALHAARDFAGSELNVEGAVVAGDALRLFQRGNGAPRDGRLPVSATADLPLPDFLRWLDRGGPPPRPARIVQYDLGDAGGGVRFGFTDATLLPDGRVAFLASAEDSPDAVRDGAVAGCRFGIIDGEDVRTTGIVDREGRAVALKLEGLAARVDEPGVFDVVVDMDRHDEAARIGTLAVTGLR